MAPTATEVASRVSWGGRGTGGGYKALNEQDTYRQGALGNLLQAAKILRDEGVNVTVKPVAFADYFLEKAQGAAKKFGVDEKFAFGGANAPLVGSPSTTSLACW